MHKYSLVIFEGHDNMFYTNVFSNKTLVDVLTIYEHTAIMCLGYLLGFMILSGRNLAWSISSGS